MSGGRKTVPLFDLLPKKAGIEDRGRVGGPLSPTHSTAHPSGQHTGQHTGHPQGHASSEVEAKPATPAAVLGPHNTQGPTPDLDLSHTRPTADSSPDSIVVPRFAFAVIVACLVALLVLAWAAGVRFGRVQSDQNQAAKIEATEGNLLGTTPTPTPNPSPSPAPVHTPSAQDPQTSASPSGTGTIYTYDGWTTADPRQRGMNYLRLATLNREQAVVTVDYVKQKGKRAIAVPSGTVDRSPGGGKNPTYFVYLLTPLSRDQYRDAPLRNRIENEIKEIGRQWAKLKDRGPTDFSQPGWVKYE